MATGAVDWPGWTRSGKDGARALAALAAAAPRYALVAAEAGVPFAADARVHLEVVERVRGSATTDFGALGALAELDTRPLTPSGAERTGALVAASWAVFDRVTARAPAGLRKGPRGGGRDRDAIVAHVVGAEVMYVRKLGIRLPQPAPGDAAAVSALRGAFLDALRSAPGATGVTENGWPARYAARRIAWHVLDHAWEIEDRSEPAT